MKAEDKWYLVSALMDRLNAGATDVVIITRKQGKQVIVDSSSDDPMRAKKVLHLAQVQVEHMPYHLKWGDKVAAPSTEEGGK